MTADFPTTSAPPWLGPRLKALWLTKQLWMVAGMVTFFAAYFVLLNVNFFPVTEMQVTLLDRLIGFQPAALLLYVSLWIYIPLLPGLMDDRRQILVYYQSAAILSAVGLAVFFFWPTTTPVADIDWARYPMYRVLKTVDRSGNAFPSLHAAFAVFSALGLDRLLRKADRRLAARTLIWCWCLGILYSTLATKQHVAIDLFGGVVLGIAGALLHIRLQAIAPALSPSTQAAPSEI